MKSAIAVLVASITLTGANDVKRGNDLDAVMRDSVPLYENELICERVGEIGRRVVAASGHRGKHPFRFYVLNSSDVTAFSVPSGSTYVTTGLLRHLISEDELAAVLGHEIAHVNERHLMKSEAVVRERAFWNLMLEVGVVAASAYVSALVSVKLSGFSTTYLLKANGDIVAWPTGAAQQVGGLAANAVMWGTATGGSTLLNRYYVGYKDQYEFDADALAVTYANKAGYDGYSLLHVLERLGGSTNEIDSTGFSHLHSSSHLLLARINALRSKNGESTQR